MKSKKLHTTKIRIPELIIEKKKAGKNKIVQLAHKEEVIEVDIYKHKTTSFLFQDRNGRKFYIKIPHSKIKIKNRNVLKIKNFSNIIEIDENSELFWERHIAQSASKNPEDIKDSWANSFYFKEEKEKNLGLRRPQLGAIHSIASYWSVNKNCGTIVMPTGTGKTETMISTLVYHQCEKVLILVPGRILRKQMFEKFLSLGCLRGIGVIDQELFNPRVAIIEHGIKDVSEAVDLIDNSNVMIATSSALDNFSDEVKKQFAKVCSHLFIDEAHHVPENT